MFRSEGFITNWDGFYQRYVLVFNLIVAGPMAPFGWLYLRLEMGDLAPLVSSDIGRWSGSGLLCALSGYLVYMGYRGARKRIVALQGAGSLRSRLAGYYQIQLTKFFRYDLVTVLLLLGMVLFQPVVFAIGYLFMLFMFSLDWPSYTRVVHHLQLNRADQALLESGAPLT